LHHKMSVINHIVCLPLSLCSRPSAMKLGALLLASGVVAIPLDFKTIWDSAQHVLGSLSPSKPVVDSVALQSYITKEGLSHRAAKLYEIAKISSDDFGHPTRVIGSTGHNATIEYIRDTLEDLDGYYDVSLQPFTAVSGKIDGVELVLDGEVQHKVRGFSLTPPTPHKKPVEGYLRLARSDGCKPSDYYGLGGSIVLVKRGTCPFGDKSEHAGAAGALGLLVYSEDPADDLISGTLGLPLEHQVATVGLSHELGKKLVQALQLGLEIAASLTVDATVDIIDTINVVAETTHGDKDNVVMLGAHSDSVTEGPGINDDGSGTNSLLEVAVALTNFKVNNAVRFAWWAAEEEGLVGSDYYANNLRPHENKKIRVFMDYDMMASPNFAYQIYDANSKDHPNGSGELKQLYVDFYEAAGVNYSFVPFDGRSDYDGFLQHGIPSGGVATGAEGIKTDEDVDLFGGKQGIQYDPCYHLLCDDLDNLAYDAWEINTKLIAHSVATYASSWEGFPERDTAVVHTSERSDYPSSPFKYHGPHLVV
jgi:aminopeptidase Y